MLFPSASRVVWSAPAASRSYAASSRRREKARARGVRPHLMVFAFREPRMALIKYSISCFVSEGIGFARIAQCNANSPGNSQ